MDAVGSSRAALMGFSEGCAMSAMFAASYPERVSHLICFGGLHAMLTFLSVAISNKLFWTA